MVRVGQWQTPPFVTDNLFQRGQPCPPHCSTAMSTRPVRYSGCFAWFILLWPRHDHFTSQINFKGAVFWTIHPLVVTQLNWWKIYMGHFFTWFASINGFICKIVTKTEILIQVLLQLNTNFKRYRPIIGDMPNWRIVQRSHFLLIWLQSTVLWQKLWPRLKFWHWSLCCWVPISCDIDQHMVTSWPI